MSENIFQTTIKVEWDALLAHPSLASFWFYANQIVSKQQSGELEGTQAAHALLSVMDMPFADNPQIQDLLSLLGPLELESSWNDQQWHEAIDIIKQHS